MEDKDLITRIVELEDHGAFAELWASYERKVYALAWRTLRHEVDAQDVTQEVAILLFRKLPEFEGTSKFSSWLYRVAMNSCLMALRKRRQGHPTVPLGDCKEALHKADPAPHINNVIDARRQLKLGLAAVRRARNCPTGVPVLELSAECSLIEGAAALGITLPAFKSRLFRARRAFIKGMRQAA